jgi:sigma-B regulation protein RsbU (phosphoserine phosphatase)
VPLSEPRPESHPANKADDLEDLFENAPCGYLAIGSDGRIVRANATIARWIGVDGRSLANTPFRDLLSVPSRILYETNVAPLLRLQGRFEDVALDLLTGESDKLVVLANALERRDADGGLIALRLTMVRAEERRGYERALQTREAVALEQLLAEQSASELREQFIAVLGHDLRNPLAAVSSGVRLLQRDPSKERADQIATMMHASVLRMSGLIENVLDLARGRLGGGISLQRAPMDLESAITQAVEELRSAHPERNIEDRYDLPSLVDCDAPRMSQLVSNLVGNACTHGDSGTSVTVAAWLDGEVLEISVANGGKPIPDSQMETLFKPFSREPGSAPVKGLGLGLFIASQIAKSHGGTLTAASSARETKFTFRMPLASA